MVYNKKLFILQCGRIINTFNKSSTVRGLFYEALAVLLGAPLGQEAPPGLREFRARLRPQPS